MNRTRAQLREHVVELGAQSQEARILLTACELVECEPFDLIDSLESLIEGSGVKKADKLLLDKIDYFVEKLDGVELPYYEDLSTDISRIVEDMTAQTDEAFSVYSEVLEDILKLRRELKGQKDE